MVGTAGFLNIDVNIKDCWLRRVFGGAAGSMFGTGGFLADNLKSQGLLTA
jgi:hypothetical protein